MKKITMVRMAMFAIMLSGLLFPRGIRAQEAKETTKYEKHEETQERITGDAKMAKAAFLKADPSMGNLFKHSYGYVVFPNVGKGGIGVGGAGGRGAVYEKGKLIGTAQMVQVTLGAQAGGQAYREVVFFENKAALDRFTGNKFEFSGQVSAIAAKAGSSANANYREGVVVFTQEKGGLMLEASLGGQKFTFHPLMK